MAEFLNRILPDRLSVPPLMFESANIISRPSCPDRRLNSLNSATGCTYEEQTKYIKILEMNKTNLQFLSVITLCKTEDAKKN